MTHSVRGSALGQREQAECEAGQGTDIAGHHPTQREREREREPVTRLVSQPQHNDGQGSRRFADSLTSGAVSRTLNIDRVTRQGRTSPRR